MAKESTSPGERWANAWSQSNPEVWENIYAEDAVYTDYAFGFIRRGKKAMNDHFQIWKGANPDFRMEVVESWPGKDLGNGQVKYSIRTNNIGTFKNDLPSKPPIKASSREFNFYAVVDLVVRREDGLFVTVDEWYHRQFDYEKLVERDL